jgi:hypothetical protein
MLVKSVKSRSLTVLTSTLHGLYKLSGSRVVKVGDSYYASPELRPYTALFAR